MLKRSRFHRKPSNPRLATLEVPCRVQPYGRKRVPQPIATPSSCQFSVADGRYAGDRRDSERPPALWAPCERPIDPVTGAVLGPCLCFHDFSLPALDDSLGACTHHPNI